MKCFIGVLLLLAAITATAAVAVSDECSVGAWSRQSCGFNIDKDACLAKGCCYDASRWNLVQCFKKKVAGTPVSATCNTVFYKRSNCGFFNVNRTSCEAKGCCYDDNRWSIIQCFHKTAVAGVIGETRSAIDGRDVTCRVQECSMGDLVTDAILEYFKETKKINVLVMMNGGAFQNNVLLQPGDIKQADIQKIFPFKDTIDYVELSGSDVIAALEHSVAHYDPCNITQGPFMQVAGMMVYYDLSQPSGHRVGHVFVKLPEVPGIPRGYVMEYGRLFADAKYKVASNNFILDGGDGYSVFKDKMTPGSRVVGPLDTDVLSAYIKKHSPLNIHDSRRINVGSVPAKKC